MSVLDNEHAKAANMNFNTVREPFDGYWADVWLTKPFVFVKWGARATPDQMCTLTYNDGARSAHCWWFA